MGVKPQRKSEPCGHGSRSRHDDQEADRPRRVHRRARRPLKTRIISRRLLTERKRAKGDTVALTVRLSRADWMRLSNLAMAEGVSLQALAIDGLSAVLAKHGLPPLTE